MAGSILNDCGKYSNSLLEISQSIVNKKSSKEPITEKLVADSELEVFLAYQQILSNANNCTAVDHIISESINRLSKTVEKGSDLNNLKEVANTISKSVANEINNTFDKSVKDTTDEGIVATAIVVESLSNEKSIVNKIYDLKLQNDINSLYDGAQKGNEKSIAKVNEIEKITAMANVHQTLDEKTRRGVLARMMRLASIGDETSKKVLTQIANNYKIDIFSTDEKGEQVLDLEKLEETFQTSVAQVNPNAKKMTIEDFRKMVVERAKVEKDKGTYAKQGRNIEEATLEDARRRELIGFEQKVNNAFKSNDLQSVESLVQKRPDLAKMMSQDLSRWTQNEKLPKDVIFSYKNRKVALDFMIGKNDKSQDDMIKDVDDGR